MPATIFVMLVILVLAVGVLAVVVMGMEGQGREQHPEIAHAMAKTARHLNGEADPPRGLIAFFEEAEGGADELRNMPAKLRSIASARSARSPRTAGSAPTADSAPTPSSATSAPTLEDEDAAFRPPRPAGGTHRADGWAQFSTQAAARDDGTSTAPR